MLPPSLPGEGGQGDEADEIRRKTGGKFLWKKKTHIDI
jgi:hypothetical protein